MAGQNISGQAISFEASYAPITVLMLFLVVLIFFFVIAFFYWEYGIPAHRMEWKLEKFSSKLEEKPLEELKIAYNQLSSLYHRLTKVEQHHFHEDLERIRKVVEKRLLQTNEIEHALKQGHKAKKKEAHQHLKVAHNIFQKLNEVMQEQYHPHLKSLRKKLKKI